VVARKTKMEGAAKEARKGWGAVLSISLHLYSVMRGQDSTQL